MIEIVIKIKGAVKMITVRRKNQRNYKKQFCLINDSRTNHLQRGELCAELINSLSKHMALNSKKSKESQ